MPTYKVIPIIVLSLMVFTVTISSAQSGNMEFRSRNKNVNCVFVDDAQGGQLTCKIDYRRGEFALPIPDNCKDTHWGKFFALRTEGEAEMLCKRTDYEPNNYPKMQYGDTKILNEIKCEYSKNGMECRNGEGAGFILAAARQKIFKSRAVTAVEDTAKPEGYIELGGTQFCVGVLVGDSVTCPELVKLVLNHLVKEDACFESDGFDKCMSRAFNIHHSENGRKGAIVEEYVAKLNSRLRGKSQEAKLTEYMPLDQFKSGSAYSNLINSKATCPQTPIIELRFSIGNKSRNLSQSRLEGMIQRSYKYIQLHHPSRCLKEKITYKITVNDTSVFVESVDFQYTKDYRAFSKVTAKTVMPYIMEVAEGRKINATVESKVETSLENQCNNLTPETSVRMLQDHYGLKFFDPMYPLIVESFSPSNANDEFGLKSGDQIVFVNGASQYATLELLKGICEKKSVYAVVQRDGEYHELVLTSGSIREYSAGIEIDNIENPFSGLDRKSFYEPTWEAFFNGDFSQFDTSEKNALIVIANSAISTKYGVAGGMAERDVISAYQAMTGSEKACYQYGAEFAEVQQYEITKDSFGNVKSRLPLKSWKIHFDRRFRQLVRDAYEDINFGLYAHHPVHNLIEKYGCFSLEYRVFYDRLFELNR